MNVFKGSPIYVV